MAILGHFFTRFPVFLIISHLLKLLLANFPDGAGNAHFCFAFYPLLGIKRGARLIKKALDELIVSPLPAGLSSELLALAWSVSAEAAVEVIRDNEPSFSANSAQPFWRAFDSRNPHF
jgi:hypothetical protein